MNVNELAKIIETTENKIAKTKAKLAENERIRRGVEDSLKFHLEELRYQLRSAERDYQNETKILCLGRYRKQRKQKGVK